MLADKPEILRSPTRARIFRWSFGSISRLLGGELLLPTAIKADWGP